MDARDPDGGLMPIVDVARAVGNGVAEDGRRYNLGCYEGLARCASLRTKQEFDDARKFVLAMADRNYSYGALRGLNKTFGVILPATDPSCSFQPAAGAFPSGNGGTGMAKEAA